MRNVTKQADRIDELEKALADGAARERDYARAIEELNDDVQSLDAAVAHWRNAAAVDDHRRAVGLGAGGGGTGGTGSGGGVGGGVGGGAGGGGVGAAGAGGTGAGEQEQAVASTRAVAALGAEIAALQRAVHFLRDENASLRHQEAQSATDPAADSWLLQPLLPSQAVGAALDRCGDELARESREVLAELRSLVLEERVLDLAAAGSSPATRGKWRPLESTPRWTVARQRLRYDAVAGWKDDLVARVGRHLSSSSSSSSSSASAYGRATGGRTGRRRGATGVAGVRGVAEGGAGRGAAARVKVSLPETGLGHDVIVVRDAEGWEEVQEALGLLG